MTAQRTFFDDEFSADMQAKRLARRTDPVTSHLAAQTVPVGELQELVLEILRKSPGLTGRELQAKSGKELHKRLREMQRVGLVREGAKRVCTITGRLAITWHAEG